MRNHSASGTRRQEAYQFKKLESFAGIIGLRYGLLPYLYSEYMKAAIKDEMLFRPLSFVYRDDSQAKLVEDQLLVGESIMIAPVYEQNAQGRCVYLPEDMKMYRMRSLEDMDTEIMEKGYHYIQAKLDEVLMFIRPDHLVPVSSGGRCVEEVDENRLRVLGYIKDGAEYELYQDNGYEKDYNIQRHTSVIVLTPGGHLETGCKTGCQAGKQQKVCDEKTCIGYLSALKNRRNIGKHGSDDPDCSHLEQHMAAFINLGK